MYFALCTIIFFCRVLTAHQVVIAVTEKHIMTHDAFNFTIILKVQSAYTYIIYTCTRIVLSALYGDCTFSILYWLPDTPITSYIL